MKTKLTILTTIFAFAISAQAYCSINFSTYKVEIEDGNFIEIEMYEEKEVNDLDLNFSQIYPESKEVEKEQAEEEKEPDFDINEIIFEEESVEYEIDLDTIYEEIYG